MWFCEFHIDLKHSSSLTSKIRQYADLSHKPPVPYRENQGEYAKAQRIVVCLNGDCRSLGNFGARTYERTKLRASQTRRYDRRRQRGQGEGPRFTWGLLQGSSWDAAEDHSDSARRLATSIQGRDGKIFRAGPPQPGSQEHRGLCRG